MNGLSLKSLMIVILSTGIIASCGSKSKPPSIEDAPMGGTFSGATVDNAVFNYPTWFDQVVNKINDNFSPSREYEDTLVCVVHFQVLRSGRPVNLEVRESSGSKEFDDASLSAIERSAPFPPLPRDFREEIIGITLPVKWTPR